MSYTTFTISCEFFPPKTEEGLKKLIETTRALEAIKPEFYSVTFGAGGSTQSFTQRTVATLKDHFPKQVIAPHISCVATSKAQLHELLSNYQKNGIKKVVAIRGDIPSGMGTSAGELRYANQLVAWIRENFADHFEIEVAAYPEVHPQAINGNKDLDYFKQKVDAGANHAITQYFFNLDAYVDFVERCRKSNINIPIIPGIMPIYQYAQLARFSETCGAEIPRWLVKRLESYDDDQAALQDFGCDVVADLCERLIKNGAPSLHFFALNKSALILNIINRIATLA